MIDIFLSLPGRSQRPCEEHRKIWHLFRYKILHILLFLDSTGILWKFVILILGVCGWILLYFLFVLIIWIYTIFKRFHIIYWVSVKQLWIWRLDLELLINPPVSWYTVSSNILNVVIGKRRILVYIFYIHYICVQQSYESVNLEILGSKNSEFLMNPVSKENKNIHLVKIVLY